MSLFDVILVQPIFNMLVFIYGVIPGHDFGIALVLFTTLIRLLMWPLVKKQLHQTKVMQKLQPELQKIKKRTKGNKQLEAQLMLELYRERGVNPFSSIGLLLMQLPIFIALFAVVKIITENHSEIARYTYGFLDSIPFIRELTANTSQFSDHMLGVLDLGRAAIGNEGFYWPVFVLAFVAAALQYWQAKQLLPNIKEGRKLRDIFKDQAAGKEVDQSEMSAIMSRRMVYLFPVLTFVVSIYLSGALVVYLLTTSAVAIIQQAILLRQDTEELTDLSEKTQTRVKQATTAEIVEKPRKTKKKRGKK